MVLSSDTQTPSAFQFPPNALIYSCMITFWYDMVARALIIKFTSEAIGTRKRQRVSLPAELDHLCSHHRSITQHLCLYFIYQNLVRWLCQLQGSLEVESFVGHTADLNKISTLLLKQNGRMDIGLQRAVSATFLKNSRYKVDIINRENSP